MAVVRHVDLVICGEQWAASRVPTVGLHTVSFTPASSAVSMHGWISQCRPFDCRRRRTPAASEEIRSVKFLYNVHFIVINFQRQLVIIGN